MFGHDNDDNQRNGDTGSDLSDSLVKPDESDRPSGEAVEIAPSAPATNDDGGRADAVASARNDENGISLPSSNGSSSSNTDDLLDIKQQALQSLTPLLGHLDQTPEERFRTTMMMIQAADNQDLISSAYEAAQKISDEKVRAQALLDIVNEINYFTQKNA